MKLRQCKCGSEDIHLVDDGDADERWYAYECGLCGFKPLFASSTLYAGLKWDKAMICVAIKRENLQREANL
jgi:hypothetical protein